MTEVDKPSEPIQPPPEEKPAQKIQQGNPVQFEQNPQTVNQQQGQKDVQPQPKNENSGNDKVQALQSQAASQPQQQKSTIKQEGTLSLQSKKSNHSRRTYKPETIVNQDTIPVLQRSSIRSSQINSLSDVRVVTPNKSISEQPQPFEMSQLRRINKRLKTELCELSERLDAEITRRLTSNNSKVSAVSEKELENAHRTNDLLKKEIKRLERKVQNSTTYKIDQLLNEIKAKDIEIENLKGQIKGLKKVKTFQQKGLMEAAGDDSLIQCMKENKQLLAEIRKLEHRCDQKDRDLQKKSIVPKPSEVKVEDDRVPGLQKQVETLKLLDGKSKKTITILTFEKNRFAEENQQLTQKLQEKDKQIQSLNTKISQLRKCLKPTGRRIKTYEDQHNLEAINTDSKIDKVNSATSKKLQPLVPSTRNSLAKANNRSHRLSQLSHNEFMDSSSQKIVSTKLYVPTYPKMQQRGNKNPKAQRFNDHQYSSKILQIKVLLDQQNRINNLHAKYELGEPSLPQLPSSLSVSTFTCQPGEFIQYISGGFSDDFLDFIVFVTNQKRLIKYGVEKSNSVKFDFNIAESEYPVALFGEVTRIAGDNYRVNRIGCFIEEVNADRKRQEEKRGNEEGKESERLESGKSGIKKQDHVEPSQI